MSHSRILLPAINRGTVGRTNCGCKQVEWRRIAHSRTQLFHERTIALRQKDHTRLGAKLAGPQRKGSIESHRDAICVLAHDARQDEDWIGAAHLAEEWDGLRSRGRKIHQRSSRRTGTGEAHSFQQGMFDQSDPNLRRTIKQ